MYGAAESCSACSRPCLRLGWDHNEAIFVTDFRTCWGSRCCSRCGVPGGSAWVMVGSPGLTGPHQHNHTILQLLIHREAFSFFSIASFPMTMLTASYRTALSVHSQRSDWLLLFFSSLLHLALLGCRSSTSTWHLPRLPSRWVLWNHFYRPARCYLELRASWCQILYGSAAHSAERKAWSPTQSRKSLLSHRCFSQLC